MTCIVVTRGGFGSILRFDDDRKAFLHPVVQYGDSIIRNKEDLPDLYNRLEWPKLMRLAGVENKLLVDAVEHLGLIEERAARVDSSGLIFRRLVLLAKDPPDTYEAVAAMVAVDRVSQDKELRKEMAVENTEEKVEKVRGTGEFSPNTRITFGKDKEGKSYGPDYNPFRADSNRAKRWLTVRKNMTVLEALEAEGGLSLKNIRDLEKRGAIVLHPVAVDEAA